MISFKTEKIGALEPLITPILGLIYYYTNKEPQPNSRAWASLALTRVTGQIYLLQIMLKHVYIFRSACLSTRKPHSTCA